MLKGKALVKGCTIGIIAPSSPENKDIINEKINQFSSLGFNIKLGKHIYNSHGYLAGYDQERAIDITDMFLDPSIDGIVCFRGGYGSIRTLPYIDPKVIKRNPKFFCGYSDITIMLNYFTKLGLITFHGPMINSDFSNEETLESFLSVSSNCSNITYDLNEYNDISYINPNSFCGKIVGGNLSVICSSIGTCFEINTKNSILLIEEVNESPYAIDRMLTQLLYGGKLTSCRGIIMGSFTGCDLPDYSRSLTLKEIILDRLEILDIPIITGFPFGHSYPNITIPIGCNAHFSYEYKKLKILGTCLT
ncbi:S66 peptidase family protein [Clostridium vincentii]|uniref:Putative murein peptide carboxypeptidase n=1 Tax=Clostridium vincentii TaxID=52704 RepID=A0A2T0BAI3_9CLOT|nr:LD-carboxypeptidase [Clostridium vincentii]PRR80898.1 putative murein peptide carboxypeptidase [Clostridium vincentii]